MDIYLIIVIVLFVLAVSDLIVGVSNDAVNFLNSAIGSRVAPRHIILIIASIGILIGTTFSSGIMEVARKGIFNPELFYLNDIMVVFLAVMLTDVLLLDFFNTFALPTSTTVSIVFELLGSAVAVASIKVLQAGGGIDGVIDFINTSKAIAIITGILISVVIAFSVGALIQFLIRLLFTFDFVKRVRRFGALWGGFALSFITYFILIKGAKGASFLSEEQMDWIQHHTWEIILVSFVLWTAVFQFLTFTTKINILKPIVLAGTFALALAFAGNDLVNFIGVPLAGLSSYLIGLASSNPATELMDELREPVRTNTLLLLIAGVIMVVTLWFSKKAQSVTKTELNLGRQFEGFERFESSLFARVIVRMSITVFDIIKKIIPLSVQRWIAKRFDNSNYRPPKIDGEVPAFDLIRASVNLMVASVLISFATSLKLPLSTTYVTFMVAMGTSFSDKAWGRESAVYRVNGVFTVIGGWFFTAFMAFTVAAVFATAIYFGGLIVIGILVIIAVVVIARTHIIHKLRSAEMEEEEKSTIEEDSTALEAITKCVNKTQKILDSTGKIINQSINNLISGKRDKLKKAKKSAKKLNKQSNSITSNIFKTIQFLDESDIKENQRFGKIIASVEEIANNLSALSKKTFDHIDNNHSKPGKEQASELNELNNLVNKQIGAAQKVLEERTDTAYTELINTASELKNSIKKFDKNQFGRIKKKVNSNRNSMLFIGILSQVENISDHMITLVNACLDSFESVTGKKK